MESTTKALFNKFLNNCSIATGTDATVLQEVAAKKIASLSLTSYQELEYKLLQYNNKVTFNADNGVAEYELHGVPEKHQLWFVDLKKAKKVLACWKLSKECDGELSDLYLCKVHQLDYTRQIQDWTKRDKLLTTGLNWKGCNPNLHLVKQSCTATVTPSNAHAEYAPVLQMAIRELLANWFSRAVNSLTDADIQVAKKLLTGKVGSVRGMDLTCTGTPLALYYKRSVDKVWSAVCLKNGCWNKRDVRINSCLECITTQEIEDEGKRVLASFANVDTVMDISTEKLAAVKMDILNAPVNNRLDIAEGLYFGVIKDRIRIVTPNNAIAICENMHKGCFWTGNESKNCRNCEKSENTLVAIVETNTKENDNKHVGVIHFLRRELAVKTPNFKAATANRFQFTDRRLFHSVQPIKKYENISLIGEEVCTLKASLCLRLLFESFYFERQIKLLNKAPPFTGRLFAKLKTLSNESGFDLHIIAVPQLQNAKFESQVFRIPNEDQSQLLKFDSIYKLSKREHAYVGFLRKMSRIEVDFERRVVAKVHDAIQNRPTSLADTTTAAAMKRTLIDEGRMHEQEILDESTLFFLRYNAQFSPMNCETIVLLAFLFAQGSGSQVVLWNRQFSDLQLNDSKWVTELNNVLGYIFGLKLQLVPFKTTDDCTESKAEVKARPVKELSTDIFDFEDLNYSDAEIS